MESIVSSYEHRFGPKRTLNEDTAENEMQIFFNGPNLLHCDCIIKKALDKYFNGPTWHFITDKSVVAFTSAFETVKRLKKEPIKFLFMM